jgi:hypothetical protein
MAGESYFTLDTFSTVAGASFAIVVVTNTLRTVTRLTTPLVPFAVSIVVGLGIAGFLAGKLNHPGDWVLAFFNSCLLFCTATGAHETALSAGEPREGGGVGKQSDKPVNFWSSWLRGR